MYYFGKNKKRTLFGYSCTPSCGWHGKSEGGFSIEIRKDGELVYKTYLFNRIELTRKSYNLSLDTIDRIHHIIQNNAENIKTLDEHLDNGSLDGCGNRFVFDGKEIIAWNIEYVDEDQIKRENPRYYEKYIGNIRQENLIIYLFGLIANELSKESIALTLGAVRFRSNRQQGE